MVGRAQALWLTAEEGATEDGIAEEARTTEEEEITDALADLDREALLGVGAADDKDTGDDDREDTGEDDGDGGLGVEDGCAEDGGGRAEADAEAGPGVLLGPGTGVTTSPVMLMPGGRKPSMIPPGSNTIGGRPGIGRVKAAVTCASGMIV